MIPNARLTSSKMKPNRSSLFAQLGSSKSGSPNPAKPFTPPIPSIVVATSQPVIVPKLPSIPTPATERISLAISCNPKLANAAPIFCGTPVPNVTNCCGPFSQNRLPFRWMKSRISITALSALTPKRWLPSQPIVTFGLLAAVPVGTCKPGVSSPSFHCVAAQSITAGP